MAREGGTPLGMSQLSGNLATEQSENYKHSLHMSLQIKSYIVKVYKHRPHRLLLQGSFKLPKDT